MVVKTKFAMLGVILALIRIGMLIVAFNSLHVEAEPKTIIVPDDYATIQEAINAASPWDTVFVKLEHTLKVLL